MISTSFMILGLAGMSAAQSTVSLFLPGFDNQTLVASVIGSDATATTYAVVCASGIPDDDEDDEDCGLGGGLVLTQGPSTFAYTMSYDDIPTSGTITSTVNVYSGYVDCSIGGTTTAVCTESDGGLEANFPGISTYTLAATDLTDAYQTAALTTSSLSVLGYAASATSASTTASGSGSTATSGVKSTSTGSSTGSKTSTGTAASATGTGTAKSTSTSTGGMAMITAGAQWVVGGAALAAVLL